MKAFKLVLILIVISSNSIFSQKANLQELYFLIGTWKMEGKDNYESWKKIEDKLVGKSFKMINGQEQVSETIEISVQGHNIVYTPTVFDQNEGLAIPFILKSSKENKFSFENPEHDFPKKIQYKILTKKELLVSVLGKNDKGFSYKLMKQSNK